MFEVAKPYAKQLMAERFSPSRLALRAQREAREIAGVAREISVPAPRRARGRPHRPAEFNIDNPGIDELDTTIDHAVNRIVVGVVVAGGLVGSSIVGALAKEGPHVMGIHLLSFLGFVLSGIFGVWLDLGRRALRAPLSDPADRSAAPLHPWPHGAAVD